MATLREMSCVPPREEDRLTEDEIREYLEQVPDWKIFEEKGIPRLQRSFKFPNFADALEFTVGVGDLAEEQDHHPSLLTEWGKVTVTFWTHKIRGLHRNDFIMAAKTDSLYGDWE